MTEIIQPKIQEAFSGNSTITYTCKNPSYMFSIKNDGGSNLTFTINGITITVKPGEVFEDYFEVFNNVIVTTTVSYRALIKKY